MTIEEKVQKRYSEIIRKCLEARLYGIHMTPISIKKIRKEEVTKEKESKTIVIAKELESFVEIFKDAQRLYADKGFTVELVFDGGTGLISKWILKNRFPKHLRVDSGGFKKVQSEKTMTLQEFNSIVDRFGDEEFGSKDIQNALIGSGIGARKLQPTLGNILKGMYGPLIEKANDEVRGPGVRYRKVK